MFREKRDARFVHFKMVKNKHDGVILDIRGLVTGRLIFFSAELLFIIEGPVGGIDIFFACCKTGQHVQ